MHPELHSSQLEINTAVESTLAGVRGDVTNLRRGLSAVLAEHGVPPGGQRHASVLDLA